MTKCWNVFGTPASSFQRSSPNQRQLPCSSNSFSCQLLAWRQAWGSDAARLSTSLRVLCRGFSKALNYPAKIRNFPIRIRKVSTRTQ